MWNGKSGIFTAKAAVKREEQEHTGGPGQLRVAQRPHVEGRHSRLRGVDRDQRQDADEQEGGRTEGVEEELAGRVPAPFVAPPGDHEVHRHEGELEEDEEQQQVEREEAPEAAGFEHEDPGDEGLVRRPLPRSREGDGEQQPGHQHEEERDAVHAEAPGDPEGGDPLMARDELVTAVAGRESHRRRRGDAEHRERGDEADHLHEAPLGARDQGDDDRRSGRQQDEGREVRERACHVALVNT